MSLKPDPNGDDTKFKTRLSKLMISKGYKNSNDLARALYEQELVSVKSKITEETLEEEIKKNAIGSIVKKVRKHMVADDASLVQGEFIVAYSRLFECSADYLLGYSDVITRDVTIQSICKATGLSEIAVLKLIDPNIQSGLSELLSYMLEDDSWPVMLSDYWKQLLVAAVNRSYTIGHLEAIDKVLEEHKDEESFTIMNIQIQRKAIEKLNVSNGDKYDSKMYALSTYVRRSFEDAFLRKINEVDWHQKAYDEAYKKYKTMALLNEDTEKDFEFHEHDLNDIIQRKGKYSKE